jgi:hypothetical protein
MTLKKTSDTIVVSFRVDESAANTFTQIEQTLQLDPLNNEVFVIQAIDLDPSSPDAVAGTNTSVDACVSTVSRLTVGGINDTNVVAAASLQIRGAGYVDGGVPFQQMHPDSPVAGDLKWVAILATNNFFVSIIGGNNTIPRRCNGRMWGYRAKASASVYAALVQSELLS